MDNCGTGGGGPSTFNISTAAALVLAAGGVAMAKHGNRSASSLSGSADVAEALGLSLAKTPDEAAHHMAHSGFCFLFAPLFQPDLARMAPLRKSLGIRTFFNLLGPLMNPANVSRQMIGVSSIQHLDTLAQVLATTQVRQAYVIAGADQMDEFSLCAPTHVRHVLNQDIRSYSVTPEDFGLLHCDPRELMGGDARTNAQIIEDIMSNDDISARRDVVVMNASAGFVLAGLEANFKSGSERAQDVLKSQKAMQLLHTLRNLPQ